MVAGFVAPRHGADAHVHEQGLRTSNEALTPA